MRLVVASAILLCLFAMPVSANPSGPNSIYTGNANEYAQAKVHHSRIRHARKAHRSVRDRRGYKWSKRQGRTQVASLGGVGDFAGTISNGIVRASSGARAKVNPQYASRFQCLVRGLEARGYHIRFMGGYRHTRIAGTRIWSKHASGRAIDINQVGRNRCRGGCPRFEGIARSCGLTDGKDWRHADAGHFEVP